MYLEAMFVICFLPLHACRHVCSCVYMCIPTLMHVLMCMHSLVCVVLQWGYNTVGSYIINSFGNLTIISVM